MVKQSPFPSKAEPDTCICAFCLSFLLTMSYLLYLVLHGLTFSDIWSYIAITIYIATSWHPLWNPSWQVDGNYHNHRCTSEGFAQVAPDVVITSCIAPCRVNTKRHAWPVPTQILFKGPSSPSSPLHSHVCPRPPEKLQNNVLWVARNESRAKYLEILQILSHAHSIPVELWDIRKATNGTNGFDWFYHDSNFHMEMVEMVEICGNGKSQIGHFLRLPGSQESNHLFFT